MILAAIWLAVATYWELPVSSQQSIQSALLGTILVTEGFGYIPLWNKVEKPIFISQNVVKYITNLCN
jgi:sodium-dependent phosphate transporter